jgi:hypothetical protein
MLTLSNPVGFGKLATSFRTQQGESGPMVGLLFARAFAMTVSLR